MKLKFTLDLFDYEEQKIYMFILFDAVIVSIEIYQKMH